MRSPSGDFRLIFQPDGNLVEYTTQRPIWDTGSYNKGTPVRFAAQSDGNLAVFIKRGRSAIDSNRPYWTSGSGGKNGEYILFVEDSGKVTYWSLTNKVIVFSI